MPLTLSNEVEVTSPSAQSTPKASTPPLNCPNAPKKKKRESSTTEKASKVRKLTLQRQDAFCEKKEKKEKKVKKEKKEKKRRRA